MLPLSACCAFHDGVCLPKEKFVSVFLFLLKDSDIGVTLSFLWEGVSLKEPHSILVAMGHFPL